MEKKSLYKRIEYKSEEVQEEVRKDRKGEEKISIGSIEGRERTVTVILSKV